jgi:nucleoside phosphorylase
MGAVVRAVLALAVAASGVASAVTRAAEAGAPRHAACTPRTLVLSAMPVEIAPLIAAEKGRRTVTIDGRDYFVGRLQGHQVVATLTGIGPVNARRNTRRALAAFRCRSGRGIDAVVFSGVAGGDWIGNVTVPTRWTADAGKHFYGVDRRMLAVARRVARHHVPLEQTAPAGDPGCGCVTGADAVPTVTVTHKPTVEVGGAGQTTDPFSGRALSCVPGGGDVFGCEPCAAQLKAADDTQRFVPSVVPFADPSFFTGYFATSASESAKYVAEDEETAAVDAVATAAHLPFLGVRAISDGGGDPMHLPGFPFQFFVYRQISADNAARFTLAFLASWPGSRF